MLPRDGNSNQENKVAAIELDCTIQDFAQSQRSHAGSHVYSSSLPGFGYDLLEGSLLKPNRALDCHRNLFANPVVLPLWSFPAGKAGW